MPDYDVRALSPTDFEHLIHDSFGGAGTTLAVAVFNGRRALSFDLDEQFAHATRETLSSAQPALL